MPDHTRLKGVEEIGRALISDQLETNLISFFSWSMLGVGGFFNVTIPTSGAHGGNAHQLRMAADPYYASGQVWQGFRSDWVWESGVDYARQPIRVSGVFVNGVFQPVTGVGPYAHHIDYPNGRVVFASTISTLASVTCEYSYRYTHWAGSDTDWFRQLQRHSFRVDDSHFSQYGSGAWALAAPNRMQLPAVIVDAIPRTSRTPLAIGGGTKLRQDVLFHVVTETSWERNQLHDIIAGQWGKRIILFDKNAVADSGAYPLDDRGMPVSGARMYPDLVKANDQGGFGWRQLRFEDFNSSWQPYEATAPFHVASVRGTFEVDMP